MSRRLTLIKRSFLSASLLLLAACTAAPEEDYFTANTKDSITEYRDTGSSLPAYPHNTEYDRTDYAIRLPQHLVTQGKKLVLVDHNVHVWGAYDSDGDLIRAGIATAGGAICPADADEEDCRTNAGTFAITLMHGEDCVSKTYPRPTGGGLMPYCMYFNHGQALHGSPDDLVIESNVSHGCVRMRIPDAQWLWSSFVEIGTRVKILPYAS